MAPRKGKGNRDQGAGQTQGPAPTATAAEAGEAGEACQHCGAVYPTFVEVCRHLKRDHNMDPPIAV